MCRYHGISQVPPLDAITHGRVTPATGSHHVPGACAHSTDAFPVVGVRDMKQATEQKQMPAAPVQLATAAPCGGPRRPP
jgi:hypothetical protein